MGISCSGDLMLSPKIQDNYWKIAYQAEKLWTDLY
jgi:hypothetical protein